uniref:Hcr9-OR2A n=1 Tax=Solanum tuberosum TaxID=4113 RepID=M1A8H1_SOLTU
MDLSWNWLTGNIPTELTRLKFLAVLNLSQNVLVGPIPQGLQFNTFGNDSYGGNLDLCGLSLSKQCGTSGSSHVPQPLESYFFSGFTWESVVIGYSCGLVVGTVVWSLMFKYLKPKWYLDVEATNLRGVLTESLFLLPNLETLKLSGEIPDVFSNIQELRFLDLFDNSEGTISQGVFPLCAHNTSLSAIVVNGNQFEGPVPVSLLKCNGLEVLDVGNNAINDTFPAWLGTLQELQVLILKSNKFHGPISTCQTKFCFPKLRIFDPSCNDFSGSLPAKVFGNFKAMIKLYGEDTREIKYMEPSEEPSYVSYEDSVCLVVIKGQNIELQRISTITTTIDLSSNHFEGVIPKTLKDLSSLWLLNLSRNNLRGDIPMKLGQLSMLEALDISWNRLTGKIPQELTRMNFLAFLNLSQNHLVGPIPQGPQFNTFENDSYGGNLDLCGLPLTKKCGMSDSSHVPQQLESEEEGESYFFSGFTWESVVIGYSFGLVVGTVMWSLMFKYRKPKWFVEFFYGLMPHKRRRPKKRAQR